MAELYLLDTNVLVAYVRGSLLGEAIETKYALRMTQPAPIISIVSEGEIRAMALQRGWQADKLQVMEDLLGYFLAVPVP